MKFAPTSTVDVGANHYTKQAASAQRNSPTRTRRLINGFHHLHAATTFEPINQRATPLSNRFREILKHSGMSRC